MRELSLFTGAGGGIYASRALGWRTVGYVEFNDYRQRIIAQRIKDGIFDDAPIFGDIDAFISDGYAEGYSGLADVVTAGFPCPPFSTAGKRRAADDERNRWPQTFDCIRLVRPRYALLENVRGLVSTGYLDAIIGNLVSIGYDCRWTVVSAADVGAPHERKRLWIYAADANRDGCERANVSLQQRRQSKGCAVIVGYRKAATDAGRIGLEGTVYVGDSQISDGHDAGRPAAGGTVSQGWQGDNPEPGLLGVDDGLAHWRDRVAAAGDGWVPAAAVEAWRRLSGVAA